MKKFLINTKNINRTAVIWNMIAYTSNSFQSAILLLVISREKRYVDSAIFSIAYTVGVMLLYIGKYAVRNYQVTDIDNEFTYGEYYRTRMITVLLMLISMVMYLVYGFLFKQYSIYKIASCVLIISARVIDAIEDVFHGDLQKNGRLDISSKIWGIRNITYICCFTISYVISINLLVAASISFLISFVLFVLLNSCISHLFEKNDRSDNKKIIILIKRCWPLALSAVLSVYIANSPKYSVDAFLSSEEQTRFNIIFMPVFVISLFGNYIYNPLITKMAQLWKSYNLRELKIIFIKQISAVLFFTIAVIIGGEMFGIHLLEIMYNIPLMNYKNEFAFLMISGGGLAIFNFLIIVMTIIRKPNIIQYVSVFGTLFLMVGNKFILSAKGVLGLCVYFAIIIISIVICLFLYLYRYVKNVINTEEKNEQ